MKNLAFVITFCCWFITAKAQYIFKPDALPEQVSILEHASIADAGHQFYNFQQIKQPATDLYFKQLHGKLGNLGFTDHIYWLKFAVKNSTPAPLLYYLQTGEPVTDNVNLYFIDADGKTALQKSGDNLNFAERALPFRKTVFKIELAPGEQKQAFMEIRNDGEKNSLPLDLISQQKLLETTYKEQLSMGLFYGVLFIIAITYFFFYFALNELPFLYYSLYVSFAGLCQFALDGFYHQYIGQSNSWFNLHAVIISAILGAYFFGKYSELILNIRERNTIIHRFLKGLYTLLAVVMAGVLLFPGFLKYSYPAVNVLTLAGMLLIISCVTLNIIRKQQVDIFYTSGIFILFVCILMAILMNFGVFPENFSTDNVTKPGIGLEIIALSLSMANRIRLLKSKKEELQEVALQKSLEMNDVKSYFLSNMSHELRTPLNAILGLTSLMEKDATDQKIKANCEVIKVASYGLISSVNDILDFSMIEKGELKLDKSEFRPDQILQKIYSGSLRQAKDKGLIFDFSSDLTEEVTLIGDQVRLEQIIYNLVSNAIKFTAEGTVSLKISSAFRNDEMRVSLTITDTGIGIPKEKIDSVFELFAQTTLDHKRKFGGFGIGLSIVKALVDLHHGTIKLDSKTGIGTTCEVSLTYPCIIAEKKPVMAIVADDYDLLGKHVLVVEDNKMNQMVMKMMLKRWKNTTVSFADDGAAGLESLKNETVDLVLMDLQMPVMDGYEAITAIRKGLAGNHNTNVPIIVLTADITSNTKERVFNIGANDYLTKPVDQKTLYQKVNHLFSLSNAV